MKKEGWSRELSYDGLSLYAIAEKLGVSHVTVLNIERRALAKMAKMARDEKMLCAELFEPNGR